MAEIAPFQGIRYDQNAVKDLSKVVSPPYDIISPEDRVYYHQLHPNNFVRLILGEEFDTDNEAENRFTRAGRYLDEWLEKGILTQDDVPAIYVYQQQFDSKAILGFVAAVKLHDYSDRVILPHENTLAKPKSQLIELIRQTRANLDSVYGLYSDEDMVLGNAMKRATEGKTVADVFDRDGVRHTVWAVNEPSEVELFVDFLKDKPIAIADGHHRYETALAYRNEMREKVGCSGDSELPSDYALMTLVNVYEKDMTIFPTHRVVNNVPNSALADLEKNISELFDIEQSSKETILTDMEQRGAIGIYYAGKAATAKPKSAAYAKLEGSEASRTLELNVLHGLILDPVLGIDAEKLRNQTHVIYTRDAGEALALVDAGERQAAFLLNHIPVKTVLDIAEAGEKMPQKATYFYPKLLSGLVLRKM